jgi:hypothetical protein
MGVPHPPFFIKKGRNESYEEILRERKDFFLFDVHAD